MEVIVYPDTAAVVLAGISDAMAVDTCGTPPTDRDGTETFLVCRRVGGPNRDVVVDDASVVLEAWAPTDTAAHDLLQEVRGVLHSLARTVVDGVPIYRVQEIAGPAFLPDPESSHPRYTLTASVSVRGAVTGS